MRLPVVSSRRWVHRTALGAADVPEVNNSAHRMSGVTVRVDRAVLSSLLAPGGVESRAEQLARRRRIVAVDEALGYEDATR